MTKTEMDALFPVIKERLDETVISPDGRELRIYPPVGCYFIGITDNAADVICIINPEKTKEAWEIFSIANEGKISGYQELLFVSQMAAKTSENKEKIITQIYCKTEKNNDDRTK